MGNDKINLAALKAAYASCKGDVEKCPAPDLLAEVERLQRKMRSQAGEIAYWKGGGRAKEVEQLKATNTELQGALECISDATGKYDKAISAIAINPDPDKMTSSCTIQDDDLDELYANMLIADERARTTLAAYRKTQGEGGQDAKI